MLLFLLLLGWLAVCCCGTPPRGAAVPIAICCCCCCCIWCCKNCNCATQEEKMGDKKTKISGGALSVFATSDRMHTWHVLVKLNYSLEWRTRSVQTNTQEWLMGCRGRRRRGESWGREGSEAGHSQAAPGGALELQIIGCDLRSDTCSTATMLSAQSKSATSTGNRQQHP